MVALGHRGYCENAAALSGVELPTEPSADASEVFQSADRSVPSMLEGAGRPARAATVG